MILAAERPKHPRSGRPVCVHPEPGRGLGPDRSLAVVGQFEVLHWCVAETNKGVNGVMVN